MKDPLQWNGEDLQKYLHKALELEFWTIPLYLTALYSIRDDEHVPGKHVPAARLIESVVVQEMLHLEIVCNLSNAFGFLPKFQKPAYHAQAHIPFIHPDAHRIPETLRDYAVSPGPLDASRLKLFCVIELPERERPITWDAEKEFDSIGELYKAISAAIAHLWDALYIGAARNTRQKSCFNEYRHRNGEPFGFSQQVFARTDARKAVEAIVEQGEGAAAGRVAPDYRPAHVGAGTVFSDTSYHGELSHYQKFMTLLHHLERLPPVYTVKSGNDAPVLQHALDDAYDGFLRTLTLSFHTEGPEMHPDFWDSMHRLGHAMRDVWRSGACPIL